jgi:ribosomal protein S18 acetylase RimI-like enzyme
MADKLLIFPYHHPSDLEIITDLMPRCRDKKNISDPPTVFDIKRLLEIPVVQKRTRLWTTHEGLPVGYMLVDNDNNLVFDFLKGFLNSILEDQLVKMATEFVQENLQILEESFLEISVREEDEKRIAMLMRSGFRPLTMATLNYGISISHLPIETEPPAGYKIRQFKGEPELKELVSLHHAAFQNKNMTVEDRAALMKSPVYDPVLDIVAVTSDDKLAGYAICTIDKLSNHLSGQLNGTINSIAVHPDHQRKGLATCLIDRCLKLLSLYGMEQVNLDASSENTAMEKTALKSGFQLAGKRLLYNKKIHKQ